MALAFADVIAPAAPCAAPFPGTLSWELRADVPGGVHSAAGGVVDASLYVSHGFRGADSAVLDVYDVGGDTWSSGPSADESRSAVVGAVLDGKLYAIGGNGPSGTVEVFDPVAGAWTTVASLGEPRAGAAAATAGGLIYVFGGRSGTSVGSGTIVESTEAYDPSTDTWTMLSPLPLPVSDAAATVGSDGLIYLVGGAVSPGTYSSALQIYDPVNDEWSLGADLPVRRAALGAGTLCGQIVAYGGLDVEIGSLPQTFLYDASDDSWTGGPDMLVPAGAMAQGPTQTSSTIFSVGTRPFGDASVVVQALAAVCEGATPTPSATRTATPTPNATITAGGGESPATPTGTPAATATRTATPTPEPTATATPEPTLTVTATPVPTATSTPEPTTTATATPEPTLTATTTPEPTATVTATTTPLPTATVTATTTPLPTATVTATTTPVPTATATPEPTLTATSTPEPTETATPVPTATTTPQPTRTSTPLPTTTETQTATPMPTLTATRTTTPVATSTPTRTATPLPTPVNHPPDCSGAGPSSDELWPPNHKFGTVSIVGVTDPDGDPVTVVITSVRQDEPLNDLGDGNTCPDATGIGGTSVGVRSERSGLDDGRVYHLNFTASDGRGGQCTGSTGICVPHDQRPGHVCGDQGPLYDSTGPCS